MKVLGNKSEAFKIHALKKLQRTCKDLKKL